MDSVQPQVQAAAPPPPLPPVPQAPVEVPVPLAEKVWVEKWWGVLLSLFLAGPLGLILIFFVWKKSGWPKRVKVAVTVVIALIFSTLSFYLVTVSKGDRRGGVAPVVVSPVPPGESKSVVVTPTVTAKVSITSKYSLDTDGDFMPDELEKQIGTNPNLSVEDECLPILKNCGQVPDDPEVVKNNIVYALDSSGSMNGLIDGQTKMALAKKLLKDQLAKDAKLRDLSALVVYGHKGSNAASDKNLSCSQIETILPLSAHTTEEISVAVEKFSPTGWTPIEKALVQASELLQNVKGKKNVLVISDGVETCGGNPVAMAKQLKEQKDTTVSVLGLNLTAADQAQLKPIAEAGGGTFLNITSGNELNEIWRKTMAEFNVGHCKVFTTLEFQGCVTQKNYQKVTWFMHSNNMKVISDDPQAIKGNDASVLGEWDKKAIIKSQELLDYATKYYAEPTKQ